MPVLTLPDKPAIRTTLVVPAVFRTFARSISRAVGIARQPLNAPLWAIVVAVAVLAFGGFLVGRHRPAHHYVAYFGYPMVLDTTTGKACYAVPPRPADPATAAFPVDGTANQLDSQATSGPQIPVCGAE